MNWRIPFVLSTCRAQLYASISETVFQVFKQVNDPKMSLISCDAAQVVGWKHLLTPNFMVDPHWPCLELLNLRICCPGGLKHNLHRLQIHKDRIDLNECVGNWYLPNLQMCSSTSKKQKSLLNWRSYIMSRFSRHYRLMPTRLKLEIHWC